MNTNLHDIQADIQRLTQQQNQIQAQALQAQQLIHAQQIANLLSQVSARARSHHFISFFKLAGH